MLISLSGLAAYLLLWAATVTGIAMSSDYVRRRAGRKVPAPAHETLSLAGLGVSLLHTSQSVLSPQSVRLDLLRFAGPDLVTGWGLFVGVLALYLTAVATAAFYLRRYLGGWWRPIHGLAYAAYGAALWHALAIGANAWLPPLRWMYAASAGVLAAATLLRAGERAYGDVPTAV
jgi:DMSO/TMAO reductase YedYZ heme-binding membrane subunit